MLQNLNLITANLLSLQNIVVMFHSILIENKRSMQIILLLLPQNSMTVHET